MRRDGSEKQQIVSERESKRGRPLVPSAGLSDKSTVLSDLIDLSYTCCTHCLLRGRPLRASMVAMVWPFTILETRDTNVKRMRTSRVKDTLVNT